MTKETLQVDKRNKKEMVSGKVPAILYGKGIDNELLWVEPRRFLKVYEIAGNSTLIDVSIAKEGKPRSVLIQEVQRHPLTGDIIHIDFFQVDMKEKIETDIDLIFQGEAPAVKELGGTFVKSLDKIPVRCLPGDLVGHIEVDISGIKTFEDYIYIKDLDIPEGLEVTVDEETVVALVTPPRTAAEMEALNEEVEADISQVEGMEEKEEEDKAEGDKKEDGGNSEKKE